jgi:hypothetical protein
MTNGDDRLFQALARLPLIQSDLEWEARVRARCHSAISRRVSKRARAKRSRSGPAIISLAASIALFIYWAAMLTEAAHLAALV